MSLTHPSLLTPSFQRSSQPLPENGSSLFQATDFTCGPRTLVTAASRLKPLAGPAILHEFSIYDDANSVYMGDGQPGCTHYGLASAALRRGFTAAVYSNDIGAIDRVLQDTVTLPDHKKEFARALRRHRADALERGMDHGHPPLTARLDMTLLNGLFDAALQPMMLMRSFMEEADHWVLLEKAPGGLLALIDPCADNTAHQQKIKDSAKPLYTLDELKSQCLYGAQNSAHMILAIGNQPH